MYVNIRVKFILFFCAVSVCALSYAAEDQKKNRTEKSLECEAMPYLCIRSMSSYKKDPSYHQYTWKMQANGTFAGFLKFEYYPQEAQKSKKTS